MASMEAFVDGLPKCELHVHIEGTLEPGTMMDIAERNGIAAQFRRDGEDNAAAVRRIAKERENFKDLQDFLAMYNKASAALRTRRDFYDVMRAYIGRCKDENVLYSEIFFDPQSHMQRGVPIDDVVGGLYDALQEEGRPGEGPAGCARRDRAFTGRLIMCVLRDWKVTDDDSRKPADPAFDGFPSATAAVEAIRPHAAKIVAIGMDNAEVFGAPALFAGVYDAARAAGIRHAVAHAGEEGPPVPYISDALDVLKVERLDHGVQTIKDAAITARVARARIALTVCPTSNDRLKVYDSFFAGKRDVVRQLMDAGLTVTLNSDDPAYFGGYMNVNFLKAAADSSLTRAELAQMSRNAFAAAFAPDADKRAWVAVVDAYMQMRASEEKIPGADKHLPPQGGAVPAPAPEKRPAGDDVQQQEGAPTKQPRLSGVVG